MVFVSNIDVYMKNCYVAIFLTSLASYLAVCWTLGVHHCDASWNESVLFFVMTYLYLKKYGHPLPVALCIVAGRFLPNTMLAVTTLLVGEEIRPLASWYMDMMSAAGVVAGVVYYKWQHAYVLAALTAVAVILNTLVQPLWFELVQHLTINHH